MALCKTVTTDSYGVPASYWKITKVENDTFNKTLSFELSGFYDEQARLDMKQPLMVYSLYISPNEYDFLPDDNIVAKLYDKIKSGVLVFGQDMFTEFTDAQDC